MSEDFSDIADPDGQGSTKVDRDRRIPRFSWTPAYEATFFRSLCESVQLGLRENSSFKAEAWERATLALSESHNAFPTKSHLINKSDNARKRFRLWRGLREDPEFVYNPDTRTVTAPEDAWRRRIEREPLSRALRGRPFDHESYMEVLYPDVIGSGGAPKRIMKPKRRTDCLPGDENEVPGTSVLNLREKQRGKEGILDDEASPSSSGQAATVFTALPARSANIMSDTAALTPPDESSNAGRKRNLSDSGPQHAMDIPRNQPNSPGERPYPINSPEKRARQAMHMDLGHISSPGMLNSSILPLATPPANATPGSQQETSLPSIRRAFAEELADSVTGRGARHWREDAVDLFFRDFADESTEVQIGISQTVLSDEHTAMVFCKMPPRVREHWVRTQRDNVIRRAPY